MLTPLDIHNKVFSKGVRGYKLEEVDAFLDEVIRNYESLFRENRELKEKVALLEEEIAKNKEISGTLQKTMILAEKVMEEETQRAEKEGQLIKWEAEKEGKRLIEEAKKEVLGIHQEIERLRLFEKQLYLKHKGFLEFQMELLDGYRKEEQTGEANPEETKPPEAAEPEDFAAEAKGEEAAPAEKPNAAELPDKGEAAVTETLAFGQGEEEAKPSESTEAAAELSPEKDDLEEVYRMAQKMEEALQALDKIYGPENKS